MMENQFILLTYRFLEEDGRIASICDELGLASCGNTLDEAEAGLHQAISLTLNHMTERGEILNYLAERSITIHTETEAPPAITFSHVTMRPGEWLTTFARPLEAARVG